MIETLRNLTRFEYELHERQRSATDPGLASLYETYYNEACLLHDRLKRALSEDSVESLIEQTEAVRELNKIRNELVSTGLLTVQGCCFLDAAVNGLNSVAA